MPTASIEAPSAQQLRIVIVGHVDHGKSTFVGRLLYDTDSPVAAEGRGLARGFLFDRQGRLCVSLAQEGLVRKRAGNRS